MLQLGTHRRCNHNLGVAAERAGLALQREASHNESQPDVRELRQLAQHGMHLHWQGNSSLAQGASIRSKSVLSALSRPASTTFYHWRIAAVIDAGQRTPGLPAREWVS